MTARSLINLALHVGLQDTLVHDDLVPAQQMAAQIGRGHWPSDADFDRHMDSDAQGMSLCYWSQLAVAARAARWLRELDVQTVVDIGSGAGKFCVAGALASNCRFIGLEQRARLVAAANALASSFGVQDRVRFEHATFGEDPVPVADLYYFYNPFGENLFPYSDRLDLEVELSSQRYLAHVAAAEDLLSRAPIGTYLLAYNGFGGRVPSSYTSVMRDRRLQCLLRMWRKTSDVEDGEGELAGPE